jgi:hypothetical protein
MTSGVMPLISLPWLQLSLPPQQNPYRYAMFVDCDGNVDVGATRTPSLSMKRAQRSQMRHQTYTAPL